MKIITIILGILLLASIALAGPPTKCVWDESPEAYILGYYLYYGTESRFDETGKEKLVVPYTNAIQVEGKQNICYLLADIPFVEGTKYFIAITAYTDVGAESSYSNEVVYPVAATPTIDTQDNDQTITITIGISNCQ